MRGKLKCGCCFFGMGVIFLKNVCVIFGVNDWVVGIFEYCNMIIDIDFECFVVVIFVDYDVNDWCF